MCRRSCCCRGPCDAEGRSRAAPGVGDAGRTRRYVSAASWPIVVGIGPVIPLLLRVLRRRGAVARRAGRRGRGGNSQVLQRRELADLGRDRAVDLVLMEPPATPRVGRAPRRASGGTRGELAAPSSSRDRCTGRRCGLLHPRTRRVDGAGPWRPRTHLARRRARCRGRERPGRQRSPRSRPCTS